MPASDLNPKDRQAFENAENPPQAWGGVGAEAVSEDIVSRPENALDSPPDEEEVEATSRARHALGLCGTLEHLDIPAP